MLATKEISSATRGLKQLHCRADPSRAPSSDQHPTIDPTLTGGRLNLGCARPILRSRVQMSMVDVYSDSSAVVAHPETLFNGWSSLTNRLLSSRVDHGSPCFARLAERPSRRAGVCAPSATRQARNGPLLSNIWYAGGAGQKISSRLARPAALETPSCRLAETTRKQSQVRAQIQCRPSRQSISD